MKQRRAKHWLNCGIIAGMDVFLTLLTICFIWLYLNGLFAERHEESRKAKVTEIEHHSVTVKVA
ncbi:MAG: hypothetical protein JO316_25470 [Abitibacteriaceae bacterium]|nr:hypothetical protein [Abditibacteriaceae bacterium]